MRQLGILVRRLDIHWVDAALAVGLSALAPLAGSGQDLLPFSPAVFLCTAPLILRRRWPIPVLLIALAGFLLAGNATNLPALAGGLIAAISVGLDVRHQLLGAVVALAAAAAIALEFGNGDRTELPIPPFLAPFLLIGAAFLAGREIARRQLEVNQQRARARELEGEREAAIKAAAEAERRHIARELHDVVAHSVSVMVVQAGAARQVMSEKPDAARESLLNVETVGHEAMAELRRLLGVLGENGAEAPPLGPQPGLASIDALIARVKEAGLPVELRVEGAETLLPPGVDVAGYRVIQEALTNALKYAGGAATRVVIRYVPDAIDIEVIDDGVVATPADGIGRGLIGMRERVALFGGTIDAGRRAAGGYGVHAHLPLTDPVPDPPDERDGED